MSVVDEISTRLQTIQTLLKCRHADRIINNVDAPAAGKPLHFGFEILSGINNDLVGARASRQLAFPFISDSRVYGCSKLLCDLDQQKTDTARADSKCRRSSHPSPRSARSLPLFREWVRVRLRISELRDHRSYGHERLSWSVIVIELMNSDGDDRGVAVRNRIAAQIWRGCAGTRHTRAGVLSPTRSCGKRSLPFPIGITQIYDEVRCDNPSQTSAYCVISVTFYNADREPFVSTAILNGLAAVLGLRIRKEMAYEYPFG